MMDVIVLANCPLACTVRLLSFPTKVIHVYSDPDFGSVIDVSALVPDLVWVYRTGSTDGMRLLALAALLHIGDEASLEDLLFGPADVSPRVAVDSRKHIISFFLGLYPDLKEGVTRTGRLSQRDLHLARTQLQTASKNRR
jgi:hypothetical protein